MKKFLTCLAILATVLVHSTVMAQDQSRLQSILESGVLKVGTTGDWNPMSVRDPASGDYIGFDIDIAKQLAADMGVKIEFVPTDWKTLVNGVVADKYDLTSSASLNMNRAKVAGYSDPYFYVGTVPMTLQSNLEKFNSWDDINKAGVSVAVTLGTVFEEQAKQYFPNATIKSVEAPARDFQEVLSNRALVSITSNLEAGSLIKTYPQLAIIPVNEARSRRPLAMLLAQNDWIWKDYVNYWIQLKHAEGFFTQLEAKWMSGSE